jgi:hypothetical protein
VNKKEYIALIDDRNHWKKLCKELSDKNFELEEEVRRLNKKLEDIIEFYNIKLLE